MCGRRDDLYYGKAQFIALIFKEIGNDAVGIGMDPLTKNEYVKEQ